MIWLWALDIVLLATGFALLAVNWRDGRAPQPTSRARPRSRHRAPPIARTVCIDGVTYPSDKLRSLYEDPNAP